ncbi:hypothetical protein H8356DRAFT_1321958 [Neocallimastix lanati (nom. inval.)]|nr:hypothetical protein H8356DRAFT_1321958 [Neocallimastix sp. JGI-2020a]
MKIYIIVILISQEMGFICPEYKTIKSQITRNINKQLLPDVINKRNVNFMIFKKSKFNNLPIPIQSLFQAYPSIFIYEI